MQDQNLKDKLLGLWSKSQSAVHCVCDNYAANKESYTCWHGRYGDWSPHTSNKVYRRRLYWKSQKMNHETNRKQQLGLSKMWEVTRNKHNSRAFLCSGPAIFDPLLSASSPKITATALLTAPTVQRSGDTTDWQLGWRIRTTKFACHLACYKWRRRDANNLCRSPVYR